MAPVTLDQAKRMAARVDLGTSGFVAGVLGNVGLILLVIGVLGPGTKSERLWCLFSGVLHLAVTYHIYRRASESWRSGVSK